MLKITNAKIELFTDINMLLMTENGIRGGLTQVIKKHGIANNKYLPCYDNTKKSEYLQYEDFDSDFIKNYDDTVIRDINLK